jgi:YegS/Rv2252/BmrU family lipid kinase
MSRKFVYLINPISGVKGKEQALDMIRKRTAEKNIPFEILPTNAAGEYTFLLNKIRAEQITDVIVCGGDGTVNQVANACRNSEINIGIIPMGSGNGLAFAAKIPKNHSKALDVIFKGNAVAIDSFFINDRFSCMLCGLGFDAQVAHDFAKQKKRGLMSYVKQTCRNFLSAKPYPFQISIDGNTLNSDAFFISIANSNQFGNNFTIAPRASLYDGLLDVVIVNKMNKLRMLITVLKQIRNGKVDEYDDHDPAKGVHYFHAKKIEIKNSGKAPLHIDGDPADTNEAFLINVIEKAFQLLMP